jgi:hypothetical protein
MVSGNICAQGEDRHRWKDRVVVIHGTSEEDEQVVAQLKLLEDDKEATEDLKLVIHIETVSEIRYHCTDEVVVATREKPIASPFKVELYGLDGGLKFTSNELVPMSKFYEIINSMPMRKSELRERDKG